MRQFWAFCVFLAAALSGFGQATLMVNTNTQRVLKPAPELFWMASRADMLTALDFGTEINDGATNGVGALIHWSLLKGVPALGGGGGDSAGGAPILTNWFVHPKTVGESVELVPPALTVTTNTTWTPDFSAGMAHQITLSGDLTLNAPTNTTADMVGRTFLLIFEQGAGGGSVTPATNYLFGQEITAIVISTNAGSRSYVPVFVRRTNVFDVFGGLTGYPQ